MALTLPHRRALIKHFLYVIYQKFAVIQVELIDNVILIYIGTLEFWPRKCLFWGVPWCSISRIGLVTNWLFFEMIICVSSWAQYFLMCLLNNRTLVAIIDLLHQIIGLIFSTIDKLHSFFCFQTLLSLSRLIVKLLLNIIEIDLFKSFFGYFSHPVLFLLDLGWLYLVESFVLIKHLIGIIEVVNNHLILLLLKLVFGIFISIFSFSL